MTVSDRAAAQHVVFLLDSVRYALPLGAVREVVVHAEGLVRVPRAPPAVLGVVNLRGRVVTVVDFATLLDLPTPTAAPRKLVLLDRGRRDLALLVTEVEGVESVARAGARGLARVRGLAVTTLDPDALDAAVTRLFDRG